MKPINNLFLIFCTLILLALASCSKEDPLVAETAPVITGLDADYYMLVREKLTLTPTIENRTDSVEWLLNGERVAGTVEYTFEAPNDPGIFHIIFKVYNLGNIAQKAVTVTTGRFTNFPTLPNKLLTLNASDKLSGKEVKWEVLNAPSTSYRLMETDAQSGLFISLDQGTYQLRAVSGSIADTVIITVRQPGMERQSPYIAKVFDYLPAPGQFVNKLPPYEAGDTQEDMNRKVEQLIVGDKKEMITLGGWGGYVVFSFDHTIINLPGRRDFRILGNAFQASANPRPNAPFGGSVEPGIVMVAYDKNGNGVPDEDEWYEIKGSANFSAENELWYQVALDNGNDVRTFRDYKMTYYQPETEQHDPELSGDQAHITIKEYIKWEDNQDQEGYKVKNKFHNQSYYPLWVKEDKITYKGIRLADNGIDESGQGSYFVQYGFRYGYVDNYPNGHDNAAIDISWAIDKDGNKVDLPGIDFVKVYNGIDKENGHLGETSTEILGGENLHLLGVNIETIDQ